MSMMLIITLVMVLAVMFIMWSKSIFNFISNIFKGTNMKRHAPQPAMSPFEDGTPIIPSEVYTNKQKEKKSIDKDEDFLTKLQKAGL
jgi:hypothetical protein